MSSHSQRDPLADPPLSARTYRGFVVGGRWMTAGFLAVFFVVALFARARVVVFLFVERFSACAAVLPGVAATPDETRVECFGRWLTLLGAAFADSTPVDSASRGTS